MNGNTNINNKFIYFMKNIYFHIQKLLYNYCEVQMLYNVI